MRNYRYIRDKIEIVLVIFLISAFLQSLLTLNVKAQPIINSANIENAVNTKTYKSGSDIVFKGVFSSHSWYFNINKWWKVSSVEAEVKLSINQLVDKNKDTYVSFSVNGAPFYSKKIYYDSNLETQNIKVTIPSSMLISGNNEFKLESYLRISDLPCVDDVNLANWITIKGDSNVKVNFNNIVADNKISNFPYPYLKEIDEKSPNSSIIIPDKYSDSELSAALLLNSYFGKIYANGDYNGKIVKYSDFSKDGYINGIYIGNYNNIPKEINVDHKNNEDCTIKVLNSPYNHNSNIKLMVILCDDEKNLIKGVKALMNDDLKFQFNSDTFNVNKELKEETKTIDESEKITFKDMGADEINLKGAFTRSATLSYRLPKNRMLVVGDKIKLFMRYSENLDFDRALVTVYMNGTPIGSKKLEKESATGDEVELAIPNDVKMTSYIELKVAFDLEIPNLYCEKRQEEMPWALVTGDSYIYTGLSDIKDYYFSTYGTPFIKDRLYNDTLIVIPDNLSSEDLSAIGEVFSYLGKDLAYNNGNLKAIRSLNLNGEEKENNLIIYGTPENNKLIKKINDDLWFKYDDNNLKFLSNEKLILTDPYSSEIATFQLDISSFNPQKAMLILTSPKEDILRNSLKYLSSSKKNFELNGDSAVIDQYGNIKTYKMKKETKEPVYSRLVSLDTTSKGLLGLMILFIIFAIVASMLYYSKNKSIEKKRNKK
ncbi:cellulose biosynthesis cyclic di-GMP-binding regulatory protein BcsB [Clostridium uliginosum]|uniref:Cellulose synthase subunit n=1 Tax=Clostridium uliginosum TaxID=119641 RepID=A0A1I1H6V8_9CLOT|nr:cellulose biosynthesis cyclic di-GMP-binding regulatory protein BcsB [Clostridium uliginosum]SFC19747.1 cellulose synthase subunit [Clostridium uliginosum]